MAATVEEVTRAREGRERAEASGAGQANAGNRRAVVDAAADKGSEANFNPRSSVQLIPFLVSLIQSASPFEDAEMEKGYDKFFLGSILRSDNIFLRSVFILALTYNGGVLAVRAMSNKALSLSDFFFAFRFVLLITCWVLISISKRLPPHYLVYCGRWLNWVVELRLLMFAVDHLQFEILYESAFIASISLSLGCIVISPRFWPLNVRRTALICFIGNFARLLSPSKRLPLNEEIDSLLFSFALFILGNLGSISFHAYMRQKFVDKCVQDGEMRSKLRKGKEM